MSYLRWLFQPDVLPEIAAPLLASLDLQALTALLDQPGTDIPRVLSLMNTSLYRKARLDNYPYFQAERCQVVMKAYLVHSKEQQPLRDIIVQVTDLAELLKVPHIWAALSLNYTEPKDLKNLCRSLIVMAAENFVSDYDLRVVITSDLEAWKLMKRIFRSCLTHNPLLLAYLATYVTSGLSDWLDFLLSEPQLTHRLLDLMADLSRRTHLSLLTVIYARGKTGKDLAMTQARRHRYYELIAYDNYFHNRTPEPFVVIGYQNVTGEIVSPGWANGDNFPRARWYNSIPQLTESENRQLYELRGTPQQLELLLKLLCRPETLNYLTARNGEVIKFRSDMADFLIEIGLDMKKLATFFVENDFPFPSRFDFASFWNRLMLEPSLLHFFKTQTFADYLARNARGQTFLVKFWEQLTA